MRLILAILVTAAIVALPGHAVAATRLGAPTLVGPQSSMFGASVALSADGSTLLVGGPGCQAVCPGAAWVYQRVDGRWVKQQKLVPSDAVTRHGQFTDLGSYFGASVALSADGKLALIGGSQDDDRGAAWIFALSGGHWVEQQKLVPGAEVPSSEEQFGWNVVLSPDGTFAQIGALGGLGASSPVWTYSLGASGWTLQQVIGDGSDGFGTHFAFAGDRAIISSTVTQSSIGATAFQFTDGRWTPLPQSGGPVGRTGAPPAFVAMSADGNHALLSSQKELQSWDFDPAVGTWGSGNVLLAWKQDISERRVPVALSADGHAAILGDTVLEGTSTGDARIFTRAGANWTAEQFLPPDRSARAFADSVAISADGKVAVVGALGYKLGGAVWELGAGTPVSVKPVRVTGRARAGSTLTCAGGAAKAKYVWKRAGAAIPGAATRRYRVKVADEGLPLTCSAGGADSGVVHVAVPKVSGCPKATGTLAQLARLIGATRAQVRKAFARSSSSGEDRGDVFCLTPFGLLAGYQPDGRVSWLTTANAFYAIAGVRAGMRLADVPLTLSGPFKAGSTTFYLAHDGTTLIVLIVRGGIVAEVGIGDASLAASDQAAYLNGLAAIARQRTVAGPLATLNAYWADISAHRFGAAFDRVAPAARGPKARFVSSERHEGVQTAQFQGHVRSQSATTATIDIVSLTTHDRQFGCRSWTGSYVMQRRGGLWLIAHANIRPHGCGA